MKEGKNNQQIIRFPTVLFGTLEYARKNFKKEVDYVDDLNNIIVIGFGFGFKQKKNVGCSFGLFS